jgi:hypothetical protein
LNWEQWATLDGSAQTLVLGMIMLVLKHSKKYLDPIHSLAYIRSQHHGEAIIICLSFQKRDRERHNPAASIAKEAESHRLEFEDTGRGA